MFWALVRPFLQAKLVQRLRLLGSDLAALHAVVPAAVLPPAFGGTLRDEDEPADWLLADMRRREREGGMIGGWALPLSVEDPTGEARRQRAAATAAAAAAAATEGGLGGRGASEKGAGDMPVLAAEPSVAAGGVAASSLAGDPDPTGN